MKTSLYVVYNVENGYQSDVLSLCDEHAVWPEHCQCIAAKIADVSNLPCEECETLNGESSFSSGRLIDK